MNCCPRPKAEGNSSSVHPQLRGVIVNDCHTGRFEIVVLLPNSNIHYKLYNRHILYYDKTGCDIKC